MVLTVDVVNKVGSGGSVEVGRSADIDRWTGVGRQSLDQQRHTDNRIVGGQLDRRAGRGYGDDHAEGLHASSPPGDKQVHVGYSCFDFLWTAKAAVRVLLNRSLLAGLRYSSFHGWIRPLNPTEGRG